MMEMTSNISDDPENDLSITPSNNNGSHLRTGTRVIHAQEIQRRRHTGSPSAVAAASSTNPHLGLSVRTDSKYSKHENQRRVSNGRRNKLMLFIVLPVISCGVGFFWMIASLDTASSSMHLRREERIGGGSKSVPGAKKQVDDERVHKYKPVKHHVKQKHVQKETPRLHDGKTEVAKNTHQYDRDDETRSQDLKPPKYKVGTTFWKTFVENDGSSKSYMGTIDSYDSRDELYLVIYKEDGDTEELSPEEISRWIEKGEPTTIAASDDKAESQDKNTLKDKREASADDDDYTESDDESKLNAQDAIYGILKPAKGDQEIDTSRMQQSKYTTQLEGWNNPIPFRSFSLVKDDIVLMKNIDPDYGEIAYESIRNNPQFARIIPSDYDGVSTGCFDPNSLLETSLQKRNRSNRRHPISRTERFDPKAEGVSVHELQMFYDDDRVRITTYDKKEGDDDESRENDESTADKEEQVGACRAMEWEYGYYPTCNEFHSIDVSRPYDDPTEVDKPRPENTMMKINYINHGHYRDVFIVEDNPWIWPKQYKNEHLNRPKASFGVLNEDKVADRITKAYRSAVLKTFNWERKLDDEHREMVNIEAVVMERLRSSPRIMDIYGHCGYSVTAEVVPVEFEEVVIDGEGYATQKEVERRNRNGIRPYNNLTAEEKLGFALTMAESLADLHGFADGVIVHDDVQLCQWLRLPDGTMKLGDFNRATIMEYDVVNEKYCKFNNGGAFGNYRAPEEFDEKDLDEKIDVFSFGNNIYAMLTGLWGFYDIEDDEATQDELIDGKLPYIDPRWKERSYIERRLVELMEKCWIYDPDERVDIFYAVDFLKDTVREHNKMKEQQS